MPWCAFHPNLLLSVGQGGKQKTLGCSTGCIPTVLVLCHEGCYIMGASLPLRKTRARESGGHCSWRKIVERSSFHSSDCWMLCKQEWSLWCFGRCAWPIQSYHVSERVPEQVMLTLQRGEGKAGSPTSLGSCRQNLRIRWMKRLWFLIQRLSESRLWSGSSSVPWLSKLEWKWPWLVDLCEADFPNEVQDFPLMLTCD